MDFNGPALQQDSKLRDRPMIRRFHTSSIRLRNPYYVYDLMARQPIGPQEQVTNYGTHVMFDPSVNRSNETMAERARRVFGSLGSREASRIEAEKKGIVVCGIKVPQRPEEPTNCCMSGCVNCVWELYKDEVEEWKHMVSMARKELLKPENRGRPWPAQLGTPPDGRSTNSKADTKAVDVDDFDDGLDGGIRVFIQTEKRLRERKQAQLAQKTAEQATQQA